MLECNVRNSIKELQKEINAANPGNYLVENTINYIKKNLCHRCISLRPCYDNKELWKPKKRR